MKILFQDVRFALRQMRKRPGFTIVVVLTLALGIGANAAIFSVLDEVLLRPLPYDHPQQLIKVWTRFTGIGQPNDQNWVSAPEFRDFLTLNHSFSELAAIGTGSFNLGAKGSPQRVVGASVSPNLFPMLGAQPMIGRNFLADEAQPGRDHEAILSYGLWKRAFGGDRGVVGTTVRVDGVPFTIVGVMPARFAYPDQSEIWGPLAFAPDDLSENNRGSHGLEVLGRIKPGLSLTQVQQDMDRVARTMIEQHASYPYAKYDFGIILHPLLEETVGDVRTSLWVLMAAVGLVLLIACANVANLLLVRSSERQQEIGVRMALGASGWRLARQLLTESLVLALVGGLAGLALTPLALRGLVAIAAESLPRAVNTGIDGRALLVMLAVTVATGVLFGFAPALQAMSSRNWAVLKSARATGSSQSRRLRRALVMGETALSLLLLAGAGLLMRSFEQILRVDPGFHPDNVLTMRVALPDAQYSKPEQVRGFYGELLDRIQRLPGVQSAGAASLIPLAGQNSSGTIVVDSQSVPKEDTQPEADQRFVTPGYFRAMGISLVRGRFFDNRDSATAPLAAIVDESLAQVFWPHQDPIGKRIHLGTVPSPNSPWCTIVGVVRHVRNRTLEARSRIETYYPEDQVPVSAMTLTVLTSGNPMSYAPTIQREVTSIDPDLPVYRVRTMTEIMGESVARRRLALILLAVFACLALALAAVGIYGVTSYVVAQSQQEIGLRMALGAGRNQVLQLMMGRGLSTIVAGLGIGLLAAILLTRFIAGMLFAVRPADPVALGGAAMLLMAVALLAVLIPALRATRVDPMVALRYE
ncbi:MAG TPA: ABC transporter permease [Terracidiphilus sp.]|nr:ABC transporter permease [Terracidiphilus sp.]